MWRLVVCIAVLFLAVLPAFAEPAEPAASPQPWQTAESWRSLARGMSRFDVFRILGEPGKVASYDGFERWEYPDLRGGRVNFDADGALVSWRPPPEPRPPAAASGR